MLKLENISTYQFIYYLALSTDPNKKRISDELFWSNISNYQELENFIKYRRGENVDYNYLENELEFCNESEEYLIEDLIERLKEEIQKLKG